MPSERELVIEVPNLPDMRCEACGMTHRQHVSVYRSSGSGRTYLLCWMCAVRMAAMLDGWRPGGDGGE